MKKETKCKSTICLLACERAPMEENLFRLRCISKQCFRTRNTIILSGWMEWNGKEPEKAHFLLLPLCVSFSHAPKSSIYCYARFQYTNCESCFTVRYNTKWWMCFCSMERISFVKKKRNRRTVWFSTNCGMFYVMPDWNTIFIRGQPNPHFFFI